MLELNVEIRGEPTLVPPAEDTIEKGNLYFLSNIDNFPLKITTVYCYRPTENEGNIEEEKLVEVLKSSLSKVLVHYYPLAGRVTNDSEGRLVVDCTDEGAVFIEAKAHCTIQEIGDDTVAMAELVYESPAAKNIIEVPPLAAQVTTFKNGGFVLGLCMNHLILDGRAAMDFINAWAEIARGLSLKVPPFLDRSRLRARNPPKIEFPHHEYASIEDVSNTDDLYNENVIYKSFCFEYEKIQKLKMAAKEDGIVDKCSTFEVVSAFIWKSRTQALKLRNDQRVKYVMVVDGRLRFDPPLPENYFGDLIEKPLSFAVGLIREAIQTVTDRYMRSVIDYVEVKQPYLTMTSTLLITTWTRLSLDAMDFGWGKPFLVGPAYVPGRELAIFCSNPKEKNVIDVLLSFPASSMMIFEELMNI
ncbi:hypothetical protein RHSIM_Rhsim09G0031600 [Rhododendron simsii]|uniref:Uncharacterized protein n=1 Tax=Rhododendron simsii TaxID=118357 RepID=A0A834GEC0_RHOSS|nr:hypothetical protein RHSIM_Rhsim09G0031600 [Rhododendron simsii]